MKPYARAFFGLPELFLKVSIVALLAIACADTALRAQAPVTPRLAQQRSDRLIREAEERYYDLEYDKALKLYEEYAKQHPTDPCGVNEVLKTVIFKELYRLDLLDTTMYAKGGFLSKSPAEPADPKVRNKVAQLYDNALSLEAERLKSDPNDVDTLYCRGITHGLESTYLTLIEHSYLAALKNALAARHDHERVLQLDPTFIDAKTILGTHQYVVGSLSLPMKMLAGLAGISGNKKTGLETLRQVVASNAPSSTDARVVLAFFLRRESQYAEALAVVRSLRAERPHNYLFALEEANILKDMGNSYDAASAYRALLKDKDMYHDPHLELAAYGLGEVLRGERDFAGAQKAYDLIPDMKNVPVGTRAKALLAAGEMYDQLGNREMALKRYKQVLGAEPPSASTALAQRHIKRPYVAS